MTAAWDPQLRRQRDAAEVALVGRCPGCGQRRKLPGMILRSAIEVVLQEFPIEQDELLEQSKKPVPVAARSLLVWGLRTLGGPHSYNVIAQVLMRDRSDVIYLHQKAIALRLRSPEFAAACERMAARYFAETEIHHASH